MITSILHVIQKTIKFKELINVEKLDLENEITQIRTQADDLESLKQEIKDAVHCHFIDETLRPKIIRLHIVQQEVIAL